NGIGSSAVTLQLGQAASTATPNGLGLSCIWSSGSAPLPYPFVAGSNGSVATDPSLDSTQTESGTAWVAWAPGSDSTCATVSTTSPVYAYLQTDSVVGNRCLFQTTS